MLFFLEDVVVNVRGRLEELAAEEAWEYPLKTRQPLEPGTYAISSGVQPSRLEVWAKLVGKRLRATLKGHSYSTRTALHSLTNKCSCTEPNSICQATVETGTVLRLSSKHPSLLHRIMYMQVQDKLSGLLQALFVRRHESTELMASDSRIV
jgi:hypothetical protein